MIVNRKRKEGGIILGYENIFESDEYVYYVDCSNFFIGV